VVNVSAFMPKYLLHAGVKIFLHDLSLLTEGRRETQGLAE